MNTRRTFPAAAKRRRNRQVAEPQNANRPKFQDSPWSSLPSENFGGLAATEVFDLLYRRFTIGKVLLTQRRSATTRDPQVANPRVGQLNTSAFKPLPAATPFGSQFLPFST